METPPLTAACLRGDESETDFRTAVGRYGVAGKNGVQATRALCCVGDC